MVLPRAEDESRGSCGVARFNAAGPEALTAVDADAVGVTGDAVDGGGSMMSLKRVEGPV